MPSALSDAIFWVAVACCAVAELFILRSAFAAHPAHPAPRADGALPRVRRPVEVLWAVVPAVGLALVLAATWRALHPSPDSPTRAPASAESGRAGPLT